MSKYPVVLSIAGSDSGGGAGVQADIKTLSMLSCFATTVITAITAQNTVSVSHVEPLSSHSISAQCQAILSDFDVKAIKVGMLCNKRIIHVIAHELAAYPLIPIILDPVMVSQHGATLLDTTTIDVLIEQLLPLATLITPNLSEAEILLGCSVNSMQDMERAAAQLVQMTQTSVLIKGGHVASKTACDYLATMDGSHWFERSRIDSKHTHGTGCTLSAAIAGFIAHGKPLPAAICHAKQFIHEAIKSGVDLGVGHGHGPVDHLWQLGENNVV